MSISVQFPDSVTLVFVPGEMARLAGGSFPVAERVPGAAGEGFDLLNWYDRAVAARLAGSAGDRAGENLTARPTHLIARAADGFQAVVPFAQLGGSLLQYSADGPVRLYVPDGSSHCLNVKRIVGLAFVCDAGRGEEAGYGFVAELSPADLTGGLKPR